MQGDFIYMLSSLGPGSSSSPYHSLRSFSSNPIINKYLRRYFIKGDAGCSQMTLTSHLDDWRSTKAGQYCLITMRLWYHCDDEIWVFIDEDGMLWLDCPSNQMVIAR